jgi:hypothetical protein
MAGKGQLDVWWSNCVAIFSSSLKIDIRYTKNLFENKKKESHNIYFSSIRIHL